MSVLSTLSHVALKRRTEIRHSEHKNVMLLKLSENDVEAAVQ